MVLAAAFCVLFIGGGARFAIGLTLKSVVEEFGWGRSQLGIAVALFQIVSAVCMYVAGHLSDRMSPRLVLGGGLATAGVGIGLMSLMEAPWHALILYGVVFAIGNGAASMIPVGVMVPRAFPRRTGLANAAVSSGMSVGQLVVIAALATVLVAIGWRSVFFWLGIAHLVLAPLPLLAIAAHRRLRRRRPPRARWSRTGRREHAPFGFCSALRPVRPRLFLSHPVVAFAQDRGLDAFLPQPVALMGLTALIAWWAVALERRPASVADGGLVRRPARRLLRILVDSRRFGGSSPLIRRHLPGHRAAHRHLRGAKLRYEKPRRPYRPDHHGAPHVRRHRRISRRCRLRSLGRLRPGVRGDDVLQRAGAGAHARAAANGESVAPTL